MYVRVLVPVLAPDLLLLTAGGKQVSIIIAFEVASIDGAWGGERGGFRGGLALPFSCRHVRRRLGVAVCSRQQRWYLSAYDSCSVACLRIDLDERDERKGEKDENDEKGEKGVGVGVGVVGAKGDDATFLSLDGLGILE